MLSWINGKNWRIERKKDLMVNDYMLDKVLNKNKKIVGMIKLSGYINFVILITRVFENDAKFYLLSQKIYIFKNF